jgi:hypothetical protein
MTLWAAAWWGRHTNWCTARDMSAFEVYNRQGPLLVFRHRAGVGFWQLHPVTGEFRDSLNRQASWRRFVSRYPSVCGALFGMADGVGRRRRSS